MQKIISFLKKPIVLQMLFFFFICSWPFINYALTDGDIANWLRVTVDIRENSNWLTSINDQTHGPLIAWGATIFAKMIPHSFYMYNLFNILVGVFGLWCIYFFSMKIWKEEKLAILNTLLLSTNITYIYLAKTPMYDLPAAVFFFAFCGFYLLHILENKQKWLWLAIVMVGIGSLSRFSICMGLSGIYMLFVSAIYKRKLLLVLRDGLLIIFSCIGFNAPWWVGQVQTHGIEFFYEGKHNFFYDNFGRYFKVPGKKAYVKRDYYAFILYLILGMIPYSFFMLSSFFQKGIVQRFKKDKIQQALMAGLLPALLVFSFSGHTKLFRYIAYIFPFAVMLTGYNMFKFDLKNENWRKKAFKMNIIIFGLLAILFVLVPVLFLNQVKDAIVLFIALVATFLGSMFVIIYYLKKDHMVFVENPFKILLSLGIIYTLLFSALAYEWNHAEFLQSVKHKIERRIE